MSFQETGIQHLSQSFGYSVHQKSGAIRYFPCSASSRTCSTGSDAMNAVRFHGAALLIFLPGENSGKSMG